MSKMQALKEIEWDRKMKRLRERGVRISPRQERFLAEAYYQRYLENVEGEKPRNIGADRGNKSDFLARIRRGFESAAALEIPYSSYKGDQAGGGWEIGSSGGWFDQEDISKTIDPGRFADLCRFLIQNGKDKDGDNQYLNRALEAVRESFRLRGITLVGLFDLPTGFAPSR